jgi:hypothetical protein
MRSQTNLPALHAAAEAARNTAVPIEDTVKSRHCRRVENAILRFSH